MNTFLKQCAAEMVGTFFLVFVGCGAVIVTQLYEGIAGMTIPLAFGGVISVMIYAVGHISGAHFNPAVTLGFAIARHFLIKRVIGYITAQCLGGILASGMHALFFGNKGHDFGITSFQVPTLAAFGIEVLLTFLLMFVVISVATDTRAKGEMAGLAIGTAAALGALFGGPITGGSMNPARSLGPALVSGQLETLWLYFLAPIIGAIFGALVYEKIRCHEDSVKNATGCC